jgi:4'-phosphopantetheinyl transferase
MIQVYYAYTASINEIDLYNLVEPISERMKFRIAGFKEEGDRLLTLASLYLLKQTLIKNSISAYKLADLKLTDYGKPYFEGASFDFSISHSDGCAAVSFSTSSFVGLDIEKIKAVEFSDFKNIFTKEVWNDINASTDSKATFYHYWTLMESAVKADGRGLSLISNKLINIIGRNVIIDGIRWYSEHHLFDPAFSCCITSSKQEDIRLSEIKFVYNESLLSYTCNLQSRCISMGRWA